MIMPEVLPRIQQFFADGGKSLAVFMALVYRAVKLLPDNHPYLQAGMSGRFTVKDVIGAAASEITFDIKHIDQIIVFFSLIIGLILLILQFVFLLTLLFVGSASAAEMPANYQDLFRTPNPQEDIALRVLDSVFGVPNLFGSKDAGTTGFHEALQGLFQLYSIGLLVIAGIIIIYFIFVVLAETAQTGTPFGKRFNHAWAPIRLVAGIGLLIPIGAGLNSAQWVTLYAAKLGSGFATVGWNKFNETIENEFVSSDEMIGIPNMPEMKDVASFMMLANACKQAYIMTRPETGLKIEAYVIDRKNGLPAIPFTGHPSQMLAFEGDKIYIRFGEFNDVLHKKEPGCVFPHCGEVVISRTRALAPKSYDDQSIQIIELAHMRTISEMWDGANNVVSKEIGITAGFHYPEMQEAAKLMMEKALGKATDPDPSYAIQDKVLYTANNALETAVDIAAYYLSAGMEGKDNEYIKYGWGGAGIWYNKIANINGEFTTAVLSKPQVSLYPKVMEFTCKEKRQQNKNVSQNECFNPKISKGIKINFSAEENQALSSALYTVFSYWNETPNFTTGNVFVDTVKLMLGAEGIFNMCKSAAIHPLAQLSSAGKGLIEAAIRNLGFSIGGGIASIIPYFGPAASAAGGMFGSVASIGLLIGFILYYMIPLLPFLYFFFAVGTWVRGIFEAMVGVPLWALAHLRIDGEGLPGEAASGGYFLIFEVFIRPMLILFGLLASVIIFAAMVKVLNEVFHLAVSNLAGFEDGASTTCGANNTTNGNTGATPGSAEYFRGPIDQFFFTVLYVIIVYLTATSCFKLIDRIPNEMLRWLGSGDKAFGDDAGQTAEGVLQKVAVGGTLLGQPAAQIGKQAGGAVSSLGSGIASKLQ